MTDPALDDSHVRPMMREFLTIEGTERIAACWDRIWIATPSTRQAFDALEFRLQMPSATKPRGLTITGDSDTGKSRIMKAFKAAHRGRTDNAGGYASIPVVYLRTVTAADPISLYKDILGELGHPLLYNAKEADLKRHTIRMIKGCQVGIVMIDEFNDILNEKMDKKVVDFLRTIKSLMNATERPFAVCGTPAILDVTGSEDQIGGRLKSSIRLKAFTLSEYLPVALAFEKMLPLRRASNFRGDNAILGTLFDISQGLIGRLSDCLQDVSVIAIETGEERITPEILSKVRSSTQGVLGNRR